jgi:hypothetical protein
MKPSIPVGLLATGPAHAENAAAFPSNARPLLWHYPYQTYGDVGGGGDKFKYRMTGV